MRPILNKTSPNCQNCLNSFNIIQSTYNCKCCGKRLCDYCSRFIVLLGFLCYNHEERICENCKRIVIRIKSEETESHPRLESKSFARQKTSELGHSSVYESIRRESSQSILKTGCPSGLNTLS